MTKGNLGESVFWTTSPEGGVLIIAESCSRQQAWQPSRMLRNGILIGQHRAQRANWNDRGLDSQSLPQEHTFSSKAASPKPPQAVSLMGPNI